MLLKTQSFEFEDFFLDTREKVLLRDGKPVSITPKSFELLFELVKNHGHLLSKKDLLNTVWAQSFVEEGNLTFTIRLLRKTLNDDAKNPRFIETVTKRGYRFIGDVRVIETEKPYKATSVQSSNLINQHQKIEASKNGLAAVQQLAEAETPTVYETSAANLLQLISLAPHSLFGRKREIAAIENLLHREDVRLITLTGVGGSGKTSLARLIAADRSDDFPDGVFFVELAPIFNPDLVIASIAQTLDVKESSKDVLLKTLQNFLRERRILLVLDNFEQVLSAAPLLEEILLPTRRLKSLVTSRVALRLNIENELLIPPLALPPLNLTAPEIVSRENYPSVQMFVERAQKVNPNFVFNVENALDIAQICARLDGLPLAIELAAARTRLLTPSVILERLENSLQFLTSRISSLPARQQTMRDTIAWSFNLLGEKEQNLFKKLTVFSGGFSVESAEIICADKETNGIEILDSLESLVAGNLLQQSEENGEAHLRMLETIREFAAKILAKNADEESELYRRHAEYFLAYAKKLERGIMGAEQVKILNRMEAERYNFRGAMDYWKSASSENELKLTSALAPLWTFRGYLGEGIKRLSEALEKNPDAESAARAKTMTSLGQLIWVKGDYVQAIEICEQSLTLARKINYPMMSALSLFFLGMSHWYCHGDAEKAIANLTESLDLYRELKFDSGIVFTTVVLAAIYQTKNNLSKATQLLDESMAAGERSENNLARSIAMVNYGRLKFAEGDYAQAKNLCQQSLRLREEIFDLWGIVQCLEPLTAIAVIEGAPKHAAKLLGAIDVLLESLGAQPPMIFRADHEPSAAAVRTALDKETFDRLFAEGRKLSVKEAVALALAKPLDFCERQNSVEPEKNNSDLPQPEINKFKSFYATHTAVSVEKPRRKYLFWLAAAAVFLIAILAFGFWYLLNRKNKTGAPILTADFVSEKLSTNGKVAHTIISADGKNVFYTNESAGNLSVWLRQIESGNNIEIIPPSEDIYAGLTISPDGDFLYLARRPRGFEGQADIYRVSSFGGVPTKIISQTQGWMSVSPDGGKISFVRCYNRADENCSLWIADSADGKNEKMLVLRPPPFRISANNFSPDGKTIAFAAGQSKNGANDFGLSEVDVENGSERALSEEKFFNIKAINWLADRNGLLFTALKMPDQNYRIWHISGTSGDIIPLTKDSETYSNLSLDKQANLLVATQIKENFRLRLLEKDSPSAEKILANAETASFAPDGKIVFSSQMSRNRQIWIINSDGSGQKQLTNDDSFNTKPVVSPDNAFIFFTSNRTGDVQIWKMNADGSNQIQITKTNGGFPISVALDGKWLFYHHGKNRTLWRISLEDGSEQMVYDKPQTRFAVSPDGLQFAFERKQGGEKSIVIVSIADARTVKTVAYGDAKSSLADFLFMPDGKTLAYVLTDGENGNNILRLQSPDKPIPTKIADLGNEEISETSGFAVSPDGKIFTLAQGGWLHDAVLLKGLK
ncbi:MAG: winged helix-turn-helix domain-containing protein [Pyrinomonadaceae bacterium]